MKQLEHNIDLRGIEWNQSKWVLQEAEENTEVAIANDWMLLIYNTAMLI